MRFSARRTRPTSVTCLYSLNKGQFYPFKPQFPLYNACNIEQTNKPKKNQSCFSGSLQLSNSRMQINGHELQLLG